MKTNILYIILFLYPLSIKSMKEDSSEKKEKKSGYSSSEGSWRDSMGIRRKRAKSMLGDPGVDEGSSSSVSSELADSGELMQVDVVDLLTVYFGKVHTGKEPYYRAVKKVIYKYKSEAPEKFKEIGEFLNAIKDDKKKKTAFHKDFLLDNKKSKVINKLLGQIINDACIPLIQKKNTEVKKTKWLRNTLGGTCIGCFAVCGSLLIASLIPAIVHCYG